MSLKYKNIPIFLNRSFFSVKNFKKVLMFNIIEINKYFFFKVSINKIVFWINFWSNYRIHYNLKSDIIVICLQIRNKDLICQYWCTIDIRYNK